MSIWDWIGVLGLVVLGSGVFALMLRIFVLRYFEDLLRKVLHEYDPGYRLGRSVEELRRHHAEMLEMLEMLDMEQRLLLESTQEFKQCRQEVHADRERLAHIAREKELTRIVADQRDQLQRLSAELTANKAQQSQLEDALSAIVSERSIEQSQRSDRVWFAAFAPNPVLAGATFLLDIWAHTLAQSRVVAAIAAELARPQKVGVKAGIPMCRGTTVTIEISIPTFDAKGIDCIVWDGEPVNASFSIVVPETADLGSHSGAATISVAGLRIAKLWFSLTVGLNASQHCDELPTGIRQFRSAFASYATSERSEVLARVQGIKKVAPDMEVFLDVMSLRSGENWQECLAREVPSKDVFYLFWSQAAAASEWVAREWSLALTKRGLDYIDPVPLQDPRLAPPPNELSELHFNDAYLAYIELERQLSSEREGDSMPAGKHES